MNPRRLTLKTTGFALSAIAAVAILSVIASAQTKLTYSEAKMAHPDWVQVPGELIRPDCVHALPNGAAVSIRKGSAGEDVMFNGVLIAHYDPCPEAPILTRPSSTGEGLLQDPGTGNGWVEASQWLASLGSGDNMDLLQGTWTVPSNPGTNGALIYLFNGIEPSNFSWILQPVLQYGFGSVNGGGNYWGIASWLVGSSAYYSPLESVNSGDKLTGYTKIISGNNSNPRWKVDAKDNSTGAFSYLEINTEGGLQWEWALAGVIEVYGVTSCSEFPSNGKAVFTNPSVDHGYPNFNKLSPQWGGMYWSYGGPSCNFNVSVGKTKSTLDF